MDLQLYPRENQTYTQVDRHQLHGGYQYTQDESQKRIGSPLAIWLGEQREAFGRSADYGVNSDGKERCIQQCLSDIDERFATSERAVTDAAQVKSESLSILETGSNNALDDLKGVGCWSADFKEVSRETELEWSCNRMKKALSITACEAHRVECSCQSREDDGVIG